MARSKRLANLPTNVSKSACDVKTHLDAFLCNPRRGAALTPSRGYLEFPMELLVLIKITDINITKITDINIMDKLGSSGRI